MSEVTQPQPPFDRAQGGLSKVGRPRRRRPWKIVGRVAIALVIAAGVVILLAPTFTPESVVRRQVAEVLSEHLGRPVTMDSVRFGWTTGLDVRGLVVMTAPDLQTRLARAARVTARFGPLESLKAAFGGKPPMDSMRVEGLEVWLVYAAGGPAGEGRWNFESSEAVAGAAAKAPRLIQVIGGTIHFENKVLGRRLTLTNVHASLGQLESTGQGYIGLAADLPGSGASHILLNAGLDSLDLGGRRKPAGSFNVEWSGLAWPEVAAAVSADPRIIRAAGQTSGRVSATFARGAWNAEGTVEAQEVALPEAADWAGLTIPAAAVGFQVRQAAAEKPVEVSLLKITAPGVDVKAWGTVRLPATEEAAAAAPKPEEKAKGKSKAPPLPPAAPPEPAPPTLDLHVAGHVVWAPLSQPLGPMKTLAARFDELTGSAEVAAHLVNTAEGLRIVASADFLHTQAVCQQVLRKEAGRPLRLDLEARVPAGSDRAEIGRLELAADPGRALLKGEVPLRLPDPDVGRRLAGARLEVRADVRETETLLAMVPALGSLVAPADIRGPMSLRLVLEPVAVEGRAPSRPVSALEGRAPSRPVSAVEGRASSRPDVVPEAATTKRGPPNSSGAMAVEGRASSRPVSAVEGRASSRPVSAVEGRASSRPDVVPEAATTERGPPEAAATTERGPPPAAPVWTAQLHADLTPVRLYVSEGADKRSNAPATLDATAVVDTDARQLRLLGLSADLGGATLQWEGSAQVDWPQQAEPTGKFKGAIKVTKIEAALPILLPTHFDPEAASVSGDAILLVEGDVADGRLTGKMTADLGPLAIRYRAVGTDYFLKPAGQAASVGLEVGSWQMEFIGEERVRHHIQDARADLRVPGARLVAIANGVIQVDWELVNPEAEGAARQLKLHGEALPGSTLDLRAALADTAQALLLSPALGQTLKDQGIEGSAEAVLVLALRPHVLHVDASVDLTGAGLRITRPADAADVEGRAPSRPASAVEGRAASRPASAVEGRASSRPVVVPAAATTERGPPIAATTPVRAKPAVAVFSKPAAMPAKVALVIDIMPPQGDTLEAYLSKGDVELGESTLSAHGRIQIVQPGPVSPTTAEQALALFKEGELKVRADVRHSPALRQTLPCLEGILYSKADLDGLMTIAADFSGTALRGKVHLETDGTACAILHNETVLKPAGTAATLSLDARYGEAPGELRIDALEMKLADSVVSASARLLFDDPRLLAMHPPSAWSVHLEGRAPDASVLASLFPARLGDMKPAGGVTFKVDASGDPMDAELAACDFAFDRARIWWLGKPFALNGILSYDGQRLATDGLNIVAGQSDVTVVAYVVQPNRAPTGSVILRGKRLALNELLGLIQDSSERLAQWAAAEPAPAGRATPQPLSEQLGFYAQRLLGRARLSCEIQLDHFIFTVPDWKATYEPSDVTGEGRLADQRLVVSHLEGGLNGGSFAAEVTLDFRGQVPVLNVAYEARDLQMQENLKPFIESTFPGMQVFGKVTQRNANTRHLTGPAYPTGHGETVLTDGLLEGPAAPEYVTNILPGLKMNQYRFNRMVSKFEDKGNGDADNQMTFFGKEYDVYIFGTTKADGRVQYTAGVDLALSLGLKESGQPVGKLPLMIYTGRIVGSKFAELNVRYLLPHEFAYESFVRRSLVEQLFTRKGEPPPRLQPPPAPPIPASREGDQP